MALIKCTECGKEMSDKAKACPNCACPIENKIIKQKGNKKLLVIGGIIVLLFVVGIFVVKNMFKTSDFKNSDNSIIIGEWLSSTKDYFEFFDDNTFEYTCYSNTCPADILKQTPIGGNHKTCYAKGTYELKNEKSIYLYPQQSNCDIASDVAIWAFASDYTYFCANNGGVCFGGWQQTSTTPYHLNNDGSRIK